MALESAGYGDSRWLTFNNAKDASYWVKKGAKAIPVKFWRFTIKADNVDENGNLVLGEDGAIVS
ncbi:MAG: ArdC family protein [Deltaproteobacteria bacterium]|nr:ArdC family protein [Deltaproteobacteria bacterium]